MVPENNSRYLIAQANLQRSELATAELVVEAAKRKVDFAIVQEPYIGCTGRMKNYSGVRVIQCDKGTDKVNKSAIALFNSDINITLCPDLTTENITAVKMRTGSWELGVVSVYLEGDKEIEPYIQWMGKVIKEIGTKNLIMGGDVNAWNTWWGSERIDHRGEVLAGVIEEWDMHILNRGSEPTFDTIRGGKRFSSCVDVTVCSTNLFGHVDSWRVIEGMTSSDHNAILINLNLEKSKGMDQQKTTRIYNTKKANWSEFRKKLTQIWTDRKFNRINIDKINDTNELDETVKLLTETIKQASDWSIPKVGNRKKVGLPWWNEELAVLKKDVTTKKRRIRCAAPVRREAVVQKYIQAKELYELEAKKAQTTSWKKFCEKQDRESMWDGIYRVIGCTTNRTEDTPLVHNGKILEGKEAASLLAEIFYPEDEEKCDNEDHRQMRIHANRVNGESHGETCDPPFTAEELRWAALSFNPKKAPGLDGLTADICSAAITLDSEMFLGLMNKCLGLCYYPTIWKEAVVVVLRKMGKEDYTHPKSYRPIGLLPVLGKILEKMLMRRMRWHISPGMSAQQYGFTPQRGTEDALYVMIKQLKDRLISKELIVLISLDIEGAFDSAWWPAMRCGLARTGCPVNLRRLVDSYLQERRVRVRYAGAECIRETKKGCVQGSIGGPAFWNLLLDPLLKELSTLGYYSQAFADDIALIISGKTALEVQTRANAALEHVRKWGIRNKLKFAPLKTKAMLITNKLKYDTPLLNMGGVDIAMSKDIKILGLTVDEKLTFNTHVSNVCRKAINLYKQLSRAAKIHWGLEPGVIRTIYTAVVEPVMMYAAAAWAPATNKLGVQKHLNAVQRGFVQKIIKSYRTVSLNSALVIAGLLPLDIRIREAASLFEIKKGYSQRLVGDAEIEKPTAFVDVVHPVEQIEIGYSCLADGAETSQDENNCLKIYTDGSKIQGKVGAALSIWTSGAETKTRKLKLANFCTVYQAELLALSEAVKLALEGTASDCSVYSDSRAALDTIACGFSLHPLAVVTRRNIKIAKDQNRLIRLHWVKAHVGLEGNERADELAKDAALNKKTKPNYDMCPVSFIKRQIRMESLVEWNRRYVEGDTAATTRVFLPDVIQAYRIVRKMELNAVIVQVMTGHGGFSEYLNRFKCKESPSCICDPEKHESILHLLTECPVNGKERVDAGMELGIDIKTVNIQDIMNNNTIRKKFLNYCERIARQAIKRNSTV